MAGKRLTKDIVAVGAASLAVSVVTEKVLLTPQKEIPLGENIRIPVEGLFALSQDYVASLSKTALNTALPWYANTMSGIFNKFGLKQRTHDAITWVIYDFLGRYSLNTLVSHFAGKKSDADKSSYKNVLSGIIEKYIKEKADRDVIIQNVAEEIVRMLRILCEGTLAALIFNDRFAKALSDTIAAAVDRFVQNEAAAKVTDFVFDMASHLEKMTLPNFLSTVLGITKEDMVTYIDMAYDLLLGDKMVEVFSEAKLGDAMYAYITDIDFDAVGKYIGDNMKNDLIRLNMAAVSNAASFYTAASGVARTVGKQVKRVSKITGGIKKITHRKKTIPAT